MWSCDRRDIESEWHMVSSQNVLHWRHFTDTQRYLAWEDRVATFLIWQYLGIKANVLANRIRAASLTEYLPTPKRFMWHTYYADADRARVLLFSSLSRIILSFPRQFVEQSIKWHMEPERVVWVREREPLRLLWLFVVAARLAVNYEAHFYALEMPGRGRDPLICIRAEW